MSRPRLSFTERRRRQMAAKLVLDRLETRWLMHHGNAPWGTILGLERLRADGVGLADARIGSWINSHRAALEHVWAGHPRWAAAIGLPRITAGPAVPVAGAPPAPFPPVKSSAPTSTAAPLSPPPAGPPPPIIPGDGIGWYDI